MKRNFSTMLLCVKIAIFVLSVSFCAPVFSQTKPDALGFDHSVFEYHFSRADRELSPDNWITEARAGIGFALNAWELFASGLYDNPLLFQEARKNIEEWSAEEFESRFFQWLCGRFFGSNIDTSVERIVSLIDDIHLRRTYHVDSEGNIIYDSETGTPSIIRPGQDGENFSDDLEKWRAGALQESVSESNTFEESLISLYPEIAAFVPESLRQNFSAKISEAGFSSKNGLRKEFEALIAREERIFYARRMGDVWSLRKKSEGEAAGVIATQIIAETEDACARDIAELNCRIEEASAGTGDLALLGDEWLELYKQQFDRGLKAWEEAEERFFIRRFEWEQDSGKLFDKGDESWLAAFDKLEDERKKWELKTKELLESGESFFNKASENLEKAIAEAKKEFEYQLQIRAETEGEKARALIDMYLVSAYGLSTSRENLLFWIEQYGDKNAPGYTTYEFHSWLSGQRINVWNRAAETYRQQNGHTVDKDQKVLQAIEALQTGSITNNQVKLALIDTIEKSGIVSLHFFNALEEITRTFSQYQIYRSKVFFTKNNIIRQCGNLFGKGLLADVLENDAADADFCLDEYQVALIKAEAIAGYWEKKTRMAQAVFNYQQDLGVGRMTESESIRAWETAQTAYEESVSNYEIALNELYQVGADIKEKQHEMSVLSQKMVDAEAELNRMNNEYASFFATKTVERDNYILKEFNSKYADLLDAYKIAKQTGKDVVYSRNVEDLLGLIDAQNIQNSQQVKDILINGDGEGLRSLADLKTELEIFSQIIIDDDFFANKIMQGLQAETGRYNLIASLIDERNKFVENNIGEETDFKQKIENYNKLVSSLYVSFQSEAEINIKIREAGILLFSDTPESVIRTGRDYSGVDWYFAVKGIIPSDFEKENFNPAKLRERLSFDLEKSFLSFLTNRVNLELEALDCFLNGIDDNQSDGAFLSEFCVVDQVDAEKIYSALLELDRRIKNLETLNSGNDTETDRIIATFLSGASVFTGSESFLGSVFAEYQYCLGLMDIYDKYGSSNIFSMNDNWLESARRIKELFSGLGIVDVKDLLLPDAQDVCDNLFNMSGDFAHNTAQFLYNFDQCIITFPDVIKNEFLGWKDTLVQFIVFTALCRERAPEKNLATLENEINGIFNRYEELKDCYSLTENYDKSVIDNINNIYAEIIVDETILNYEYLITEYWNDEKINNGNTSLKHWRQYVNSLCAYHGDMIITGALTQVDGMCQDAREQANINAGFINDFFRCFYEDYNSTKNMAELIESCENSAANWQEYLGKIQYLKNELVSLGKMYDRTKMNPEELAAEKLKYEKDLKEQEAVLDDITNKYSVATNEFYEIGTRYDARYKITEEIYEQLEDNRFHLEIEEAIRQWASTPYLEKNTTALAEYEEKFERAKVVLAVLSDLYKNEDARPYNNSAYSDLYEKYRESFSRLMRTNKAYASLNSAVKYEMANNDLLFQKYYSELSSFGAIGDYSDGYISGDDKKQWNVVDLITVKNGLLAFRQNSAGELSGIDEYETDIVKNYFYQNTSVSGRRHNVSQFETELIALSQRMSVYFKKNGKYAQWAAAQAYLIENLSSKNQDIEFLKNKIIRADQLISGSFGSMQFFSTPHVRHWTIGDEYENEIRGDIRTAQKNAWNALNDIEKADLEFYTILTLSVNSNDYISGLLQYVAFAEYEAMYKYVNGLYIKARDLCDQWWNPRGWFYYEMRDVNRTVTDRLRPQMNLTKKYFEEWQKGLSENILRIFSSEEEYLASCAHLAALQKEDRRNTPVKWNEVESAVISSGIVDKNELADLKIDFDKMIMETGQTFFKVSECLSGLVQWARDANDKNKLALENQWTGDSVVQKNNERELFVTINSFIENGADIDALNNAVENAFGEEAASWKTHLVNVKTALLNDFSALENYPVELPPEYYALGDEYTALIDRVVLTDFDMELAARETEWEIQRKDINDKYRNWRQNIDLILEKGRLDWKTGHEKMVNSYRAWREEFSDEYQNINNSWNEAYAAGLIDKEDWLAKVKKAADKASVETLLSLTGLEAERLTRIMDTRMPAGMITGYPTDEIENTLFDLLNTQGIRNLDSAAYLLDGMKSVTQPVIRQGMHGGTWDAGMIKAAAFDLARETNLQLAARESRKLAMTLSSVAEESIRNLGENIKSANDSFKKSMDNVFIIQGQWSKSGNNYIKNILVASTFTQPVVTEQKTVAGYRDYYMEPVTLKTNVDEGFLANLDSFATRALIDSIYSEVNALTTTIFGIGEESRKINAPLVKGKTLEERFESPGLFGKHIGYEPLQKKLTGQEESRSEIFYDQGSGELGRLMSDFVFWAVIDGQGIAELSMAPWDKPLWDSRNSSFEAPSLRQSIDVVAQVGLGIISAVMAVPSGGASTIGFMALMAAVNVSDDLVFAGLDVAYGYKTIDEAGFEFGKAALISTVSTFGSGVFNGVAQAAGNGFFATGGLTGLATRNISNAFGKVAVQTAMGAAQAGVTGVISSAINGITYDSVNRFGYSLETFQAGLKSAGVSALVSTTSVFTSGMLKIANSGLNHEKLKGFSKVNKNNIERLNNFVGAIGGQGVQYALTGDFTLNILNTGLIPGSKANTGLLELHFGSGDPRLEVGTGGANVSPDNIAEVVSGARVWNINNRITGYTANSDFKEKNTLRALYGFGDKKQQNQLYNILDRKDNIIVETEKEYAAKTEIVDGQRVIRIGNYQAGMSAEDQMRLAVILGHEAYRDGYSPGKLNNTTDLSAIDSNSDEIMKVSVARIMMADRVNQDYQWFYDKNRDFAIESTVYELAVETGDMSLFEDYLDLMYKNEEDYFWQWASTGGDFQNKYESLRDIPLFNGPLLERLNEVNDARLEIALHRLKNYLAKKENYKGDMNTFVSKEGDDTVLRNRLRYDKELQEKAGYRLLKYESIYLHGCMFMATKYGLEAVLGYQVDMMWMHEYIKKNNLVINESDLSKELMAKIVDRIAGDQYTVKLEESGRLDAKRLSELGNSEDKYMAHLRVKNGDNFHSVMVSGIDYIYDKDGNVTGVKAVHVANPWNGSGVAGKKSYTLDEIERWDIFKITENNSIFAAPEYPLFFLDDKHDRFFQNDSIAGQIYQWKNS